MWLIAVATLSYALMVVALSRGPHSADSNIVGTIINLLGALIPFTLFLVSDIKISHAGSLKGISWAVAGGVGIAVFTLAMARLFVTGWSLALVSPIVYGGAILIVSLIGAIAFKEELGIFQLLGLLLVVLGIGTIIYGRSLSASS